MSAKDILIQLQIEQQKHDIKAHKDIYWLPTSERIKHLTLHIAKYAGRLSDDQLNAAEYDKTLVDIYIILLSAADTLSIDLSEKIDGIGNPGEHADLSGLGASLGGQIIGESQGWYFRKLVSTAGKMAKACESLDHLEDFPSRQVLETSIVDLCVTTLAIAAIVNCDLAARINDRWMEVESMRVY